MIYLLTERGVVWEETIILLPDNVHFVFLSATIPNASQFAEWISYLHKQVHCSTVSLFLLRGAFKKFCNSTVKNNGNVTNYTLFLNTISTEFNAFATFFWQTVISTKIEIFCLALQPLLDSFLERFIVRIADRRSESSATWHDNVQMSTLL